MEKCDFCSRYAVEKEKDSKLPETVFRECYCALGTFYADKKNHTYVQERSPVYQLNFCPVCGTLLNDKYENTERVKGYGSEHGQ